MTNQNTLEKDVTYTHRIYGKHKSQKQFKAMNIRAGKCVGNLIYASMFTESDAVRVLSEIAVPENADWEFKIVKI